MWNYTIKKEFKIIEAIQFNGKHPLVITCTGRGSKLEPVAEDEEVFGPTRSGIKTLSGIKEIQKGDWIIKTVKGYEIMDNDLFMSLFDKVQIKEM